MDDGSGAQAKWRTVRSRSGKRFPRIETARVHGKAEDDAPSQQARPRRHRRGPPPKGRRAFFAVFRVAEKTGIGVSYSIHYRPGIARDMARLPAHVLRRIDKAI